MIRYLQTVFLFIEPRGEQMAFYQRAFRYVQRKKSKSILLFSCFLIISTMVLCATMILQTAQATSRSMQAKTGSKLVLEDLRGENDISAETLTQISNLPQVKGLNRLATGTAYPANFSLVTLSASAETSNSTATLHTADNTELDGPFAQEKYRLLEGTPITETQNGILIDSILAQVNQLKLGDQLTFNTGTGATASGTIIGTFFSGIERTQDASTNAAYRIENQIFVDHALFETLFGVGGFSSVSVYTSNPENLNNLYQQTKPLLNDTTSITTSDTLYRQMQAPLSQVTHITLLMLVLIVATAVIVTSLLLCMWMRMRTREMAILISMGISKIDLWGQVATESLVIFLFSTLGAVAFNGLVFPKIMQHIFSADSVTAIADAHLQIQHILFLLLLGSAIVLVAVGISILPILRSNPRDTLSKMEG